MKLSVLQVSKMWKWLDLQRSNLPTDTILSISLMISTAILVATPAQADIVPDQPETLSCIEIVNLAKYPDYQIFARTRIWQRQPIENEYIRDVALKPGMCLQSGRRETIDFYATKKINLTQINLIPASRTEQIKGLNSLQTKLILGKDVSTPNNSSQPFSTKSMQRKLEITNLDVNNFKFKTQQYVYSIDNSWIFVIAIGLLLTVLAIGLRLRHKASLQRD
jgi:CRISPR/Cas system CMR-associated protein Cmr5 small subunit